MKRIALIFVLALPMFGQTQPTFKATLRWMHNTASYEGTFSPDGAFTSAEIPLTNTCQDFVIIQRQDTSGRKDGHRFILTVHLNLATIDPTDVYATPASSSIWAGTTDDSDTISITSILNTDEPWTRKTSGLGLEFSGTDYAPRFARALKHAVVLCGGRPSAF